MIPPTSYRGLSGPSGPSVPGSVPESGGVRRSVPRGVPKALWARLRSVQKLRKRPLLTGVKIAKIGKRGFRGQKTPISQSPRNVRFESKNPHFSTGLHIVKENGVFLTQSAHFWDTGKWEFFDLETLFSQFWRF